MSAETDQADRVLLAERVMRWKRGPKPERFFTDRYGKSCLVQEKYWDPFANVTHAIEVMEALPKDTIVLIRFDREIGYIVRIDSAADFIQDKAFCEKGFARTLTTAIVHLVRERPDLFGGAE